MPRRLLLPLEGTTAPCPYPLPKGRGLRVIRDGGEICDRSIRNADNKGRKT
jgi:hypothetical protein